MAKPRPKTDRDEFKLMTPEFRGSFVHLVKARSYGDGEPKFSITVVLERDDPFWAKLEKRIDDVARKKFGSIPERMESPIKSGKDMKLPEFKGMDFCRAQSTEKPGVVDVEGVTLLDRNALYSGAWYRAVIKPYAWEFGKKRGVSIQLDNVLKVRDDDPLSGKASAADDFADYVDGDGGEDEDRPRRSSPRRGRDADEEEEERPARRKPRDSEEEDERPARRPAKGRDRDEEEDERPARRRPSRDSEDEGEEEDDRPARRRSSSRDADEEDERPRRKRSAID